MLYRKVIRKITASDLPVSARYPIQLGINYALQLIKNGRAKEALPVLEGAQKLAQSRSLLSPLLTVRFLLSELDGTLSSFLENVKMLGVPELDRVFSKLLEQEILEQN